MNDSQPTTCAVLYAAKSTADRHRSIETQLEDGRRMAAENGWTVVAEHRDEGFSAYSGNRGAAWPMPRPMRSAPPPNRACRACWSRRPPTVSPAGPATRRAPPTRWSKSGTSSAAGRPPAHRRGRLRPARLGERGQPRPARAHGLAAQERSVKKAWTGAAPRACTTAGPASSATTTCATLRAHVPDEPLASCRPRPPWWSASTATTPPAFPNRPFTRVQRARACGRPAADVVSGHHRQVLADPFYAGL